MFFNAVQVSEQAYSLLRGCCPCRPSQNVAHDTCLLCVARQVAQLQFTQAEQLFYSNVLEKTRKVRQQLLEHVAVSSAADLAQLTATARRRHQAAGAKLQSTAANELLQLRLACIHPQLTSYWRLLSSELQLDQGGALSMVEILSRMRDNAQVHLQVRKGLEAYRFRTGVGHGFGSDAMFSSVPQCAYSNFTAAIDMSIGNSSACESYVEASRRAEAMAMHNLNVPVCDAAT